MKKKIDNEWRYKNPSAVPPPGLEPVDIGTALNFSDRDLDEMNANPGKYKAQILKQMEEEKRDPTTFVEKSILPNVEEFEVPNPPEKVSLVAPKGEIFAALEEEKAAMEALRREAWKNRSKKDEPDEKTLRLLQRKKRRRIYRLVFRKVYWEIVYAKARASGVRFFERSKQSVADYLHMLAEKRIERKNRPKIKWGRLISFNRRHNLKPEDIAKRFADGVHD